MLDRNRFGYKTQKDIDVKCDECGKLLSTVTITITNEQLIDAGEKERNHTITFVCPCGCKSNKVLVEGVYAIMQPKGMCIGNTKTISHSEFEMEMKYA